MKTLFLVAFILCTSINSLNAQLISVKMEIEWRQKNIYLFDFRGLTKVPFLKISYTNTTSDSLYFYGFKSDGLQFLKLYSEENPISYTIGYEYPDLTTDLTKNYKKETGNDYNILIGKLFKAGYFDWFLFKKSSSMKIIKNIDKTSEAARNINNISQMLELQDRLNVVKNSVQLRGFNYPTKKTVSMREAQILLFGEKTFLLDSIQYRLKLSHDSLKNADLAKLIYKREFNLNLEKIRSQFICLNPYESFIQEYDLTSLLFIEGNYNFILQEQVFPSSIEFLNPYKSPEPKVKVIKYKLEDIYFKFVLPNKYMGYNLYNGKIPGCRTTLANPIH